MPDSSKINNENIYSNTLITKKVEIPINKIGSNINEYLTNKLSRQIEGKCSIEGYIKPNSINIVSYSSGLIENHSILFEVLFECLVCFPVENMLIKCFVKNITKAGIRAELPETPTPLIIFLARDHHYKNSEQFSSIAENDEIAVKIIGQRYELNDEAISVIAELVNQDKGKKKKKDKKEKKIKLVIDE